MCLGKFIITYIHHYNIIQSIFTSLKTICALPRSRNILRVWCLNFKLIKNVNSWGRRGEEKRKVKEGKAEPERREKCIPSAPSPAKERNRAIDFQLPSAWDLKAMRIKWRGDEVVSWCIWWPEDCSIFFSWKAHVRDPYLSGSLPNTLLGWYNFLQSLSSKDRPVIS